MRHAIFAASVAAITLAASTSNAAIVINEVYAGGGSSNALAAYQTDFVELFNNGLQTVDLSGYALQYASSSRANGEFNIPIGTLPEGSSILPGGFFLVQTGSSGAGGAADVTPDVDYNFESGVSGASLSNSIGSVRLVSNTSEPLDVLGWGGLTNDNFETTPETSPLDVTVSMFRAVPGVDTNNNQNDFIQGVPTPTAAIPEPAGLAAVGLTALGLFRRRR